MVAAGEHLGLFFRHLQDRHVPQHVRVEVVVERERPRLRDAHEPLSIEEQPASGPETLEDGGVEVAERPVEGARHVVDGEPDARMDLVDLPCAGG